MAMMSGADHPQAPLLVDRQHSTRSDRSTAAQAPATRSSSELHTRALSITPGGVNSPVRAFGAVGGTPRFMVSGAGAELIDMDGNRYVDLVCSWGAMILGHSHPAVVEAVRSAAGRGLSFGMPTADEVRLAEAIVDRMPAVSWVRLVTSGTEATMSAIRLARGFTGRDVIIKFAGCYHGHGDALLVAAGSGVATFGVPGSAGVPAGTAADTVVLPYNNIDAVREVFATLSNQIAAVIVEAAAANMGVVPPAPGFTATLRRLCDDNGSLLIMDEVLTGFRVSPTGWYGLDGVAGDLVTFGKVMGGGLPVAAFGGRADLMPCLAPVGEVYQAGTLAGNPVAVAAGLATLAACGPEVYATVDQRAQQVRDLVTTALSTAGVPHVLNRAGSLFSVFFTERDTVQDYAAARSQSAERYRVFFHAMLDRGVHLPPSPYEAWFLSAAHDDDAIARIAEALPAAAHAAGRVDSPPRPPM